MEIQNTTLDDLSAVIGFSATLHLAAWFGDGNNLYVPDAVEEGQLLVKLVGLPNAQRLSAEWGRQHLAVPSLRSYDDLVKRRQIGRMFEKGFGSREISSHFRMTERRVQQICRELETVGLIAIVTPQKSSRKSDLEIAPQNLLGISPQKIVGKTASRKPLRSTPRGTAPVTGAGKNALAHSVAAAGDSGVTRHRLRK